MRAHGTVNGLIREGALVFEAIYQESYRHNARRLSGNVGEHWATEAQAISALTRQAGGSITIQAGKYPPGTRRQGQILEQS